MRLNLVGQSIDDQIAELQRDLEEIKTRQFTSQDSGMLAHIARSQTRDQYGDIVSYTTNSGTVFTSQIQCPATPNNFTLNTIDCLQRFTPKHGKPAVAIPLIKLKVNSGGLHGESELFISGQWGVTMAIYNAANVQVGTVGINQSLGGLFQPRYHPTSEYSWSTMITYDCSVPFTLSYEFYVRSSDDGSTVNELTGLF